MDALVPAALLALEMQWERSDLLVVVVDGRGFLLDPHVLVVVVVVRGRAESDGGTQASVAALALAALVVGRGLVVAAVLAAARL